MLPLCEEAGGPAYVGQDREDAGIRAGFFEVFSNIATMVAESGGGGLGWLEERYRERAAKVDAMIAEQSGDGPSAA